MKRYEFVCESSVDSFDELLNVGINNTNVRSNQKKSIDNKINLDEDDEKFRKVFILFF